MKNKMKCPNCDEMVEGIQMNEKTIVYFCNDEDNHEGCGYEWFEDIPEKVSKETEK